MTNKKAFAYLRVSSKGQINGDGLDRQLDAIEDYAETQGYDLVQTFKDEGISGTLEDRAGLADVMLSLEENGSGVKTIIIEKMDRLARDLMVQEIIVDDLQKKGFDLISVHEGNDLLNGDPTRTLIRQVLGAVSQYDKTMLVIKLRVARERIRARGRKCEGRKSYAEVAPELVKEIRQLRRKPRGRGRRNTYADIAAILNERGERTLTGKEFTNKTIYQIVNYGEKAGKSS